MTKMRKAGHAVTHAEVDPDCIWLAVPTLEPTRRVIGGLSYVISASEERLAIRLVSLLSAGARKIEDGLSAGAGAIAAAVPQEAA